MPSLSHCSCQRLGLALLLFLFIFAQALLPSLCRADGSSFPDSTPADARAGQWIQFRGDRALSGRSRISGAIDRPKVLWKRFIGGRETFLSVQFGDGSNQESSLVLPNEDLHPEKLSEIHSTWGLLTPEADPDAEPTGPPISGSLRKFLKDRSGLQRLAFDYDENFQGYCKLLARQLGDWAEIWRSEKIEDLMQGLNTVSGDFDNDGQLEIAVTPWMHLWVFDATTGKTEARGLYYQENALGDGRGYGWLGAYDLDGNGKSEFVIISDTQTYVSVLGWRPNGLELLWGHKFKDKIEAQQSNRPVWIYSGPHAVADVDGDGQLEIVVTSYDASRSPETLWQVDVYEGITGKLKRSLAGEMLEGLHDLDDDGVCELFCTNKLLGHEVRLSLVSLKGGVRKDLWQQTDQFFQTAPQHRLPANIANGSTCQDTVLLGRSQRGDEVLFFTYSAPAPSDADARLAAWAIDKSLVTRKVGELRGAHFKAMAVSSTPEHGSQVLVKATTAGVQAPEISLRGLSGHILVSKSTAPPLTPPLIAPLQLGDSPAIIVEQAGERILAVKPGVDSKPEELLWEVPGRGMADGDVHRNGGSNTAGVLLADVFGDGSFATILATRGPKDQARLTAIDPLGRELWHRDYDDLPGHPPKFTQPGLSFWFAGRFRKHDRDDVVICTKGGVQTRLTLVDGRDGQEIWTQPAGGMFMSVYDHDGDGLDDLGSTCWSEIRTFKGTDGSTLLSLNTAMSYFGGGKVWPNDAYHCIADMLQSGCPQILYWPAYGGRGLINLDGKLIWEEVYHYEKDRDVHIGQDSLHPGIGDFDGDGRIDVVSVGDHSEMGGEDWIVRCWDGATGERKFELPLEYAPSSRSAMTTDIDDDGRDEILFSRGNTLIAAGASEDGKRGHIEWNLPFPAEVGPVSIGDVDSSGRARIVVTCADGYVYVIGEDSAAIR